MKTLFVGGGRGCREVLEMVVQQRMPILSPQVLGVVDPNSEAPGMEFARRQGWPTFSDLEEALALEDLELVVEVTGIPEVRDEIARLVGDRMRIMDHQMARVFWDLDVLAQNLRKELENKSALQKVLQEDRRQLQELLDSLPDSVMVLDSEGVILRVNRRFEEVTGLLWSDVEGLRCMDLCDAAPDCPKEGEVCVRARVLETGGPVNVVQRTSCIRRHCADAECYYETVANPFRNEVGEINVVITSREVTEQIRLARETEELARRADQILNTVHGIITITSLDGRLQFINPSAEIFFGIKAEEATGKPLDELLSPETAALFRTNDAEIVQEGGHLTHEEVFDREGEEAILITERVMLYDYKYDPIAICRVSRNITKSRRLQRELLESEKHAAVGKLAAGVAHELNNPLTGILTFSEDLLENTPPESAIEEDLQVIMRETLRCRQIVRDLLDYSRQGVKNRTMSAMDAIARRAVKLVEKQAAFHDIELRLTLGDGPLRVQADPNQLQQVILNLVINARDAMDGKGTIGISSYKDPEARLVCLEVSDTGCGIPAEIQEKIFEPFFSTKGDKGNGLGLAAVQSIVEEHGGTVQVESEPGRGTLFRIALPVAQKNDKRITGRSRPSYHDWGES